MLLQISDIRLRMQQGLPGRYAQLRMAPQGREEMLQVPSNARLGGVLLLLYSGEDGIETILIRRTTDGQVHSGQISLPGGQKDASDIDMTATALRECQEEIGVPKDAVDVLGNLTPLYIPPSNFLVTPTVGMLQITPSFVPSPREVEEIIRVPLQHLYNPAIKSERLIQRSDQPLAHFRAPVYQVRDDVEVWGATAMILAEFEHLLFNATET